ncbi:MAG: DNA polymerase I [Deltaproteobacteria bacterium]|nr:DNA polymerase I [Deltaproteobacteria bacterium]
MTSESQAKQLFLIDTPGFIFRAYHALPPLTTISGQPTGAAYGFCNMLFRLLDDHKPDYVAAIFDSGRASTFRRKMYSEYKANRPPVPDDLKAQFPLVKELLGLFRIPTLEKEGYEADDIIATLTRQARLAGIDATIVSSDKDLMQLVGEGVRLLDTMKERVFGPEQVQEKFGVLPEQLGDWLALVGDSSDNVPGVRGVGPKTATKLLAAHTNLEGVLAAVDEVKGKKLQENLRENADQARLSRQLVALVEDCSLEVGIEDLERQSSDETGLWRRFGELEFGRLRARLSPGDMFKRSKHRVILELEELQEVVASITQSQRFALAPEAVSVRGGLPELVGMGMAWGDASSAGQQTCYVPTSHVYLGVPRQIGVEDLLATLKPLLEDQSVAMWSHDIKRTLTLLGAEEAGVTQRGGDPLLASYVGAPSRNDHSLARVARDLLGHEMLDRKAELGTKSRVDESPIDAVARCTCEVAQVTLVVGAALDDTLAKDEALSGLYRHIELPLAPILSKMERAGCLLDASVLEGLSSGLVSTLAELEQGVRAAAGWAVNINSPKQLQKLLFEQLGLTAGRKTKTGYSTDADVLADLALEHPIAEQIEEYRTLSKLKSTYLDALPQLMDRRTKRVHTSFNQAITATGRLSSSDPNLQNIPIRTELGREIRRAFVAPEGYLLLSADYSQVELRILAHLSGDERLLNAFRDNEDVHARTAAEVFGVEVSEVSPEQRRVAKAVNFGVIYGQTDWGLSRQLRIPRSEAARYIEGYFERYARVGAFMDETIVEAKKTRMVHTLLGRRRPLPDITARNYTARAAAERMARNTPIQGTAADLIKLAMIAVEAALAPTGARMILTVHDELVLEVPEERAEEVAGVVREAMMGVMALDVPLAVDIAWGRHWGEAH